MEHYAGIDVSLEQSSVCVMDATGWVVREAKVEMPSTVARYGDDAAEPGQHPRTPEAIAHLAFGLEQFLQFAQDAGALDEQEAVDLWDQLWAALHPVANVQCRHLAGASPILRFFQLLASRSLAARRTSPPRMEARLPSTPSLRLAASRPAKANLTEPRWATANH